MGGWVRLRSQAGDDAVAETGTERVLIWQPLVDVAQRSDIPSAESIRKALDLQRCPDRGVIGLDPALMMPCE